ncbi:MAG TPA: choice-of-anchor A family protein [Bryobacteraceae bacterium]|nr:choice-of-anchor A family protein [Bryobacteraceae bacterium]
MYSSFGLIGKILILAGAIATSAFAGNVSFSLSPYNALVFGSFSDNANFGGGIAAGGSVTISSTNVADSLLREALSSFPSGYTLVAQGTLRASNGAVTQGNVYGGGDPHDFSLTLASGSSYSQAPTPDPVDFASMQTMADSLSATLSQQTPTSTCSSNGYGTTTCNALSSGVTYFNVNPSMFGLNTTVNINLGSTSSYAVFNVSGTSDAMTNWSFNINGSSYNGDSTTSLADNVLFNYYQATSLSMYSVIGTVLAPYATVTNAGSGQFDGQLIANSFSANNGVTEFHNFGYTGALPLTLNAAATPAPEPMSLVLMGAGLIGVSLFAKRRIQ